MDAADPRLTQASGSWRRGEQRKDFGENMGDNKTFKEAEKVELG